MVFLALYVAGSMGPAAVRPKRTPRGGRGVLVHLLGHLRHRGHVIEAFAVDRFIAGYGNDGGCDEGPGYWSVAAGTMLLSLEFMRDRTGGAVDIYDEPIIRQMGEYVTRVHLAGRWFANPSDASARVAPPRAITYRYGQ